MVRSHRTPVPLLPPGRRRGIAVQGQTAFAPPAVPGLVAWYDANQATVAAATETDILGLAPNAWYDFSDVSTLSGVTSDGDPIGSVADKSGNGKTMTDGGTEPTYKTGIQNGLSIARFAGGAAEYLSIADNLGLDTNDEAWTIFEVIKTDASRALCVSFSVGDTTTSHFIDIGHNANPATTSYWQTTGLESAAISADDTAAFSIHAAFFEQGATPGDVTANLNGVSDSGTAAAAQSYTGCDTSCIGALAYGAAPAFPYKGDIGEVLFWTRRLNVLERAQVTNYLADKWGLTVTAAPRLTGDPVQLWRDLSGNGYHTTQTTAAAKPTWVTGVQNSLPVVRFDGTDDLVSIVSDLGVSGVDQPMTWFIVTLGVTEAAVTTVFGWGNTGNANIYWELIHDSSGDLPYVVKRDDVPASGTSTPFTGVNLASAFQVITYRDTGTAQVGRVNGTQTGTDTDSVGQTTLNVFTIGGLRRTSAGELWYNGDIAEVILYNQALSTADMARVERYLGKKWGITVA